MGCGPSGTGLVAVAGSTLQTGPAHPTPALRSTSAGQPGWRSGLAPPAGQGVILETLDRVPRQALCMEPASPSACVPASLSLSLHLYE